jgi:2-alkenal reductase
MSVRKPVLMAVLGLMLASLACSSVLPKRSTATATPAATTASGTALAPTPFIPNVPISGAEEAQLIALYERANPSVVSILVSDGMGGGSQGSGFVYDTEGHIITNYHVVEGAQEIEVDFASGVKVVGKVVGTDGDSDLAVVKVDVPAEQLAPLPLGDSDAVRVGQRVIAIGNPFGEAGTMTLGIISGLGRSVSGVREAPGGGSFTTPDIIQTDAAINPSNSGGPLINFTGQVIGINKAIATETGVNSGVGYAISSNTVRQIVPYLIREGKFVYPYLGIRAISELSLTMQQELTLPQNTGAYVTDVVKDGPSEGQLRADTAGTNSETLKGDGDLIVAIDGRDVVVFSDLLSYLINFKRPGDLVTITVLRGGDKVDVTVTLGERP